MTAFHNNRIWGAIFVASVFFMVACGVRYSGMRLVIVPLFMVSSALLSRAYLNEKLPDGTLKALTFSALAALYAGEAVRRFFVDV
jgi:hypothetical protein